jgi:hypothetical protein
MHTQSIRKDIHDRCIQQQQDLAKKTMQDPNAFLTIEAEENSINIF